MNLSRRMPSWLAFIFFLSGFSGLVYQVVWQRVLTLYYGVGDASIAVIVSVYMAGLGFGALFGGAVVERVERRVRLYFVVELLIGAFGLVSLPLIEWLGRLTAGSSLALTFVYVFAFLFLPTFLMGTTLPILTKIYNRLAPDFLRTVSFLYFVNTLGAAAGTVAASYGLISFFGLDGAVRFAVVLNFLLAAAIFALPEGAAAATAPVPQGDRARGTAFSPAAAYACVLATGFLAIGYEIVWFRLNGVLVKASPYAFSSVLAVYLLGIALGSYGMNRLLRRRVTVDRGPLFMGLQVLIAFTAALFVLSYHYAQGGWLGRVSRLSFGITIHPAWPEAGDGLLTGLLRLSDVFLWPAFFMLLPTLLMGASFPLVSSLALSDPSREGRTVGRVYFVNVMGNVLGGLLTGFVLLPLLGTERTLLLFVLTGLVFGLFVGRIGRLRVPLAARAAAMAACALLLVALFPGRSALYATMHVPPGEGYRLFLEEGREGVVATYQKQEKVWCYINGMAHGGRIALGWYYQTIEAMTHARQVRDVLVIGYGTGSIVEMVLKDPEVERVTIVEINRTLMRNLEKAPLFRQLLADPRIDLVFDDGRRYLLSRPGRYDLVLIDPLRTTTAYSNNIYSREFFSLAAGTLKPGGVFMTYMDEFRVMPNTVAAVFPHVRIYDFFALGSREPMQSDGARYARLTNQFDTGVRPWLATAGRFLGGQDHVRAVGSGYPVNTDRRPACEYYLGLARYSPPGDD